MSGRKWWTIREDEGQFAFGMLVALLVIFVIAALSLDTGFWYFEHRDAQNDTDAAALAGALELPAADVTDALGKVNDYLSANGADSVSGTECPMSGDGSHASFRDSNGDGLYDEVTVCTRKGVPGLFAALSGIDAVHVSAKSTALSGKDDFASLMPWFVVAPDKTCTATAGRDCRVDYNYDGDILDPGEHTCPFTQCPFGIDENSVFSFKGGGGGNSGAIQACGNGASDYDYCILGHDNSGDPVFSDFYKVGQSYFVDLKRGNMGVNTMNDLIERFGSHPECDVAISPSAIVQPSNASNTNVISALDATGKARAKDRFVDNPPNSNCPLRLVPIPIFDTPYPTNGGDIQQKVLGVATFGIARWADPGNRTFGAALNSDCKQESGNTPAPGEFNCGMVWGYIFSDVRPPGDYLLGRIGDGANPFAPQLIALIN